ncbi:MAG: EamA-like transporter family protein [Microgenomates bacterium OLB23]|nr:MAG: EamA-like transporter family protein [Microgenomates bacterium OLB23]
MTWQALLGISCITYVLSQLLQRTFLKEKTTDPIAFAIVFQLAVGVIIGVYAQIKGFAIPETYTSYVPNLILTGVLYASGNFFLYKSLKNTPISEFTIVFSTSTFWTILGAVILLGEHFSLQHAIGTTLIMISLLIVFKSSQAIRFRNGHINGLIAAFLYGVAFVNDAYLLKSI